MSLWTYREDIVDTSASLVGFDVEATDGSIGKIDETSAEAGSSYVVVDTGFWIFGKKRLVPAAAIDRVDVDGRRVYVALTKEQIKSAPDFDERHRTERDEYDTYYRPFGW